MASVVTRQPLQQHVQATRIAMASRLGGALPEVAEVLATIVAQNAYSYEATAELVEREINPETCSIAQLHRIGARYGVYQRQATYASGNLKFDEVLGYPLPEDFPVGTRLVIRSNEYEVVELIVVTGQVRRAVIRATSPGVAGNTDRGDIPPLITRDGEHTSGYILEPGIIGGQEAEDEDVSFRARIVAAAGGEYLEIGRVGSYAQLALQARAGVAHAWERYQPGRVIVLLWGDNAALSSQQHDSALAYIQQRSLPALEIQVQSPRTLVPSLTIELQPNTATLQTAVTDSLNTYIRNTWEPGKVYPSSELSAIVSAVPNETAHRIVPPQDITPANEFTMVTGFRVTYRDYS